jgi:hypothetical protein
LRTSSRLSGRQLPRLRIVGFDRQRRLQVVGGTAAGRHKVATLGNRAAGIGEGTRQLRAALAKTLLQRLARSDVGSIARVSLQGLLVAAERGAEVATAFGLGSEACQRIGTLGANARSIAVDRIDLGNASQCFQRIVSHRLGDPAGGELFPRLSEQIVDPRLLLQQQAIAGNLTAQVLPGRISGKIRGLGVQLALGQVQLAGGQRSLGGLQQLAGQCVDRTLHLGILRIDLLRLAEQRPGVLAILAGQLAGTASGLGSRQQVTHPGLALGASASAADGFLQGQQGRVVGCDGQCFANADLGNIEVLRRHRSFGLLAQGIDDRYQPLLRLRQIRRQLQHLLQLVVGAFACRGHQLTLADQLVDALQAVIEEAAQRRIQRRLRGSSSSKQPAASQKHGQTDGRHRRNQPRGAPRLGRSVVGRPHAHAGTTGAGARRRRDAAGARNAAHRRA